MTHYELLRLELQPGSLSAAQASLQRALHAGRQVSLVGAWYSEIGPLNQLILLRGFADLAAREAERERCLMQVDPFGVSAWLQGLQVDDLQLFPFARLLQPGAHGPWYELREYRLLDHGLPATLAGWQRALGPRGTADYSANAGVFYATSGALPRILHLWPYASLEQRLEVRSRSVADGVWPPENSTPQLRQMQSTVCLPCAFSPLR